MSSEPSFEEQFMKFADARSFGRLITLRQIDRWMRQANVFDEKISPVDTSGHYKRMKSAKLNFFQYENFLQNLASGKEVGFDEMKNKLIGCGEPVLPKPKKVHYYSI